MVIIFNYKKYILVFITFYYIIWQPYVDPCRPKCRVDILTILNMQCAKNSCITALKYLFW
jgi:hypothetical protein